MKESNSKTEEEDRKTEVKNEKTGENTGKVEEKKSKAEEKEDHEPTATPQPQIHGGDRAMPLAQPKSNRTNKFLGGLSLAVVGGILSGGIYGILIGAYLGVNMPSIISKTGRFSKKYIPILTRYIIKKYKKRKKEEVTRKKLQKQPSKAVQKKVTPDTPLPLHVDLNKMTKVSDILKRKSKTQNGKLSKTMYQLQLAKKPRGIRR
ncbi:hypothetical protein [Abyssalbus ytuae]|uniref:Transmembrane protein n=1 Tax=Abyssalbus ytuae TaxID=2926907 RepID=A0A9E7CSQ1_9FLAO|nr:hypothetical protein [Abyssalbus ytuae]UOB16646.1 hypothetical protein MQE35_12980 [Abyssalbus ytuae]